MEKRLQALGDAMNHAELAPNVLSMLRKITQALDSGDYNGAHVEATEMFSKVGGAGWSVGVRRLVETVIAVHQQRR